MIAVKKRTTAAAPSTRQRYLAEKSRMLTSVCLGVWEKSTSWGQKSRLTVRKIRAEIR